MRIFSQNKENIITRTNDFFVFPSNNDKNLKTIFTDTTRGSVPIGDYTEERVKEVMSEIWDILNKGEKFYTMPEK